MQILGQRKHKLYYTNFKVDVITSFKYFSPDRQLSGLALAQLQQCRDGQLTRTATKKRE